MENPALRLRHATQTWMPADLIKAVQAALLAELPRQCVLEFWARHPFTLFKGPLSPGKFFRYMWEGRSKFPPFYFWAVLADLETFLSGKGIRPDRIFQLINHGSGGGPPLDPDRVLRALPSPLSRPLPTDPHGWLLDGLPDLIRDVLPGCRIEGIGSGSFSGSRIYLFQALKTAPEAAAPDFRLFPGKLLLNLPKLFGCAAFNRMDLLADMRGPTVCLGGSAEDAWNWKGDHLHYRQRRMGRMETLGEAIEAWPEAVQARLALEDLLWRPVLRMERDFALAGEPLLSAGRIYGSPVGIFRLGYAGNRSWDRLAAWLRRKPGPAAAAVPTWEVADRLHRELIEGLE